MMQPVDLKGLCDKHGITVQEHYGLESAGHVVWDQVRGWVIYVRKEDPFTRRRFTIAHELGHFFLHLGEGNRRITNPLHRAGVDPDAQMEREANQFAASLLMPAPVVTAAWKNGFGLEDISRGLQVSRPAMEWRLHNLGLNRLF